MKINNNFYEANLCTECGCITSYKVNGRELLASQKNYYAMMIKLIDNNGEYVRIYSDKVNSAEKTEEGYKFTYKNIGGLKFDAETVIKYSDDSPFIYLTFSYKNNTGYIVELVDFGSFTVPNNLRAEGGDGEIFWPAVEGCIIENANARNFYESTSYTEPDYDVHGWRGYYPGMTSMQFMSYYTKDGGFYLAAHDNEANLKMLEYHPTDEGVRLENFVFPGDEATEYNLGYDIVLGAIEGDWYTAADIYRGWLEESGMLPQKSRENKNVPKWMDESPVVCIYPVRGEKDTEDMTPNCYFPIYDGLEYVYKIGEKADSKIMPLLMHWEGTAPWAPPFAWPPFGGEEAFKKAVDKLHADGNFMGIYASGIGWTTYSYLNPEYKTDHLYKELEIEKYLCRTPKQTIDPTNVVGPPIKAGHNICPANETVKNIAVDEIVKAAKAGVDYYQFFDQNLGGQSCFCYSKAHNHAPSPGKWMTKEMKEIYSRALGKIHQMGSGMAIGCEGGACETFIGDLTFNDLRFNACYYFGRPVQAYNYVMHEYINNFMGNSGIRWSLDFDKCPECLAMRIGYNFANGNIISLTLGDKGNITWGWGVPWSDGFPKNQDELLGFVKNLNGWRKGIGKNFLRYGRMEKPCELIGVKEYTVHLRSEDALHYPELFSGRFTDGGEDAQFVINYFDEEKTFTLAEDVTLYTDSAKNEGVFVKAGTEIKVAPLSAVMVKF